MQIIAEMERGEGENIDEKQSDDFGMNDEDWDVYKDLQRDGASEDEEEDQA